MSLLNIRLLGQFEIALEIALETAHEAEPVSLVNTPRLQSLLAYLLLTRKTPQTRQRIAFYLWPDSSEVQARSSLRNLLYQLRAKLPDVDHFILMEGQTVQWKADAPFVLDVADFEAQLANAAAAEDNIAKVEALAQAVARYTGPLLPECYDDWILPERERLHQLHLSALTELVSTLETLRRYAAAIRYGHRLLAQDDLREATYRQLMRLYMLNDERSAALDLFHTCTERLQAELGVAPDASTQQLHAQLLAATSPVHAPQPRTSTVPMVGRDQEWAQLLATWQRLAQGQRELVILKGEAGIGKTKLAETFLDWAARQGASAAAARCYAVEGDLAYAPLVEWLRASPFARLLPSLSSLDLNELTRLLPELVTAADGGSMAAPLTDPWHRRRFFEALARAIFSTGRPLVLFLDNLQWCDRETLEWLHFLLHFPANEKLLIVSTLRSGEIQPEYLGTTLLSLRSHFRVSELALNRLSPTETAALAEAVLGRSLNASQEDALYHESEGNPLFAVEILRAGMADENGAARPQLAELPHLTTGLLPKVQATIEYRLAQLAPAVRELVGLAAVIGRSFGIDTLVAASGEDLHAVEERLDELWKRSIVRERASGDYDFSHDKIRLVSYQSLSPAQRRSYHRRVGEALLRVHAGDRSAVVGQAATHFEKAHAWDEAFRHHLHAAELSTAMHAYHSAAQFYARALHAAGYLNPDGERLTSLYLAQGRCLEHTGRYAEALEVYRKLEAQARARGDRVMEGAAVAQLIKCYMEPSDCHEPAQAERLLARGLSLSQEAGLHELEARLLWSKMVGASHYGSDDDAQVAGRRAVDLARRLDQQELLAHILNDLSINLRLSGHQDEAAEHASEARRLFSSMNNLPMLADSLSQQAWSDYLSLRFDAALQRAHECVDLSRTIENGWNLSLATFIQALVHMDRGNWGQALTVLEESMAHGERGGFVLALTLMPAKLGDLLRQIGQGTRAFELHQHAHEVSRRRAPFLLHAIEAQLALDAFALGDVDEGKRWLASMRRQDPRGAIARAWVVLADPVRAHVAAAAYTGDWRAATVAAEGALAEADRRGLPVYRSLLLRLRGECAAALDQHDEAAQRFSAALYAAQHSGLQAQSWQACAALSAHFHRSGDNVRAWSARAEAIRFFNAIAATLPESERAAFLRTPSALAVLTTQQEAE